MLPLKGFFVKHENRIVLFIGVILLSIISYGIGRLSAPRSKEPITIEANSQELFTVQKPVPISSNHEETKQKKIPEISQENNISKIVITPVTEDNSKDRGDTTEQGKTLVTKGLYVASKNGTKYHLPTCPGAKRIKEENKIWFDSKTEAEQAGYEPAKNCKGI